MILSKAEKVLREIEGVARRRRFLPIVGPNRGQILVKVVREIKPKRVLEIGTLIGYSAILMGKELGSDAHLITIEIDANNAEIAKENIRKAEIPPTVEVLVGDAIEIIPTLEGMFDLVFIDADKAQYLDYLRLVEEKLHKGSVIVADNVEHAPSYLDYVKSSGKYSSRFESIGPAAVGHHREDGLEISVKL
ncbi:MAG: O-methyltransferase [Candidatus Bathyarchaeota archaeon]|jgi:predicted O-methyltransferase YrrM|nr:O-methyltransferase [Candidatus Bathyarchaeota archaeon A05DMB-5]MDH7557586.1 O-methyltransferase [Candidatus Bathyarchaeota archaeon]